MTHNAILTGPAWQAPINIEAGDSLLLSMDEKITVEWAATGPDGDAPDPVQGQDEFFGHPIPPTTARQPNGVDIPFAQPARVYLRARGLAQDTQMVVPYTIRPPYLTE